jgi:hypothetical protein
MRSPVLHLLGLSAFRAALPAALPVLLSGCPSSDSGNPRTLWLSSLGFDETHVQLVETEPPPF